MSSIEISVLQLGPTFSKNPVTVLVMTQEDDWLPQKRFRRKSIPLNFLQTDQSNGNTSLIFKVNHKLETFPEFRE